MPDLCTTVYYVSYRQSAIRLLFMTIGNLHADRLFAKLFGRGLSVSRSA